MTRGGRKPLDPGEVISALRLAPHPEGGWFREIHRSERTTAIYFLLTRESFSAFHRLRSEELWIPLGGDPLELLLLGKGLRRLVLAAGGTTGASIGVVPPEVLQAARTMGEASLAACIVSPPFVPADFFLPSRHTLLGEYPEHAETILSFTR